MKLLLSVLVVASSLNVFAGLAQDFEQLKNLGLNLEPTGAICEDVAQLRFAEKYPQPQYSVLTGIEYGDRDGTIGELDLVVFNNNTHIAEIVAEVKCWSSAKSGLKKAKDQRNRFLTNVRSMRALQFKWLRDPKLPLAKTQFKKVSRFYFIAQANTLDDGFDFELPYTLKELMQLRSDILDCQASGACQKAGLH